jgi:regulator of protease activity HflC (stomatin/prohibitin superfamily)
MGYDGNPARPLKFFVLAFFAFMAVSLVSGSFYTVEQGQVGIRLRFGALVGVEEPGIGFKIPFAEIIRPMSVRTEKIRLDQIESYSKDIQAAILQISVNFHVEPSKAGKVYSTLGLNYADRVIVPTTLRIAKEVFGQYNAQNIIAERMALGQHISSRLRDELSPHGIEFESFQMEDVSFSHEFEQSIEARMQAEVEVARLRQNLDREKVQADIARTQAAGRADSLRAQAQAEADAIALRGAAEAKVILARGDALKGNPQLIQLTQAEKWNGVLPSTMLPTNTLPMIDLNTSRSER